MKKLLRIRDPEYVPGAPLRPGLQPIKPGEEGKPRTFLLEGMCRSPLVEALMAGSVKAEDVILHGYGDLELRTAFEARKAYAIKMDEVRRRKRMGEVL